MKQLKTLIIAFLLLGMMSCEPCEDQGKENIQISVAEEIDSIRINSTINFEIIDLGSVGNLYKSGFVNSTEEIISVTIYLDSIRSIFEFDVVQDAYHEIFISDTSRTCLNKEQFETRNNINTCNQARFFECP